MTDLNKLSGLKFTNLKNLNFLLEIFRLKALQEDKTLLVEPGESKPSKLTQYAL